MIPEIDSDALEAELSRLRDTELSREQIDEIIHGLGDIIGVEDLALDEQGVAELTVDDDVELSLIHLPAFPGIVAAAAMPEGAEENDLVLRRLLQTNMSWSLTQGGSFVMVPPRLALCRLVPLATQDSNQLDHELATFVDLVQAWRGEIEAFMSIESQPQEETESGDSEEEVVGLRV